MATTMTISLAPILTDTSEQDGLHKAYTGAAIGIEQPARAVRKEDRVMNQM
jgi:hypothetical protein